jgi:hypothetical protein
MPDEDVVATWPIDWEPAVRSAIAQGEHPDRLLDDPNLVAHRILDRLGALANEVIGTSPWLTTAADLRNSVPEPYKPNEAEESLSSHRGHDNRQAEEGNIRDTAGDHADSDFTLIDEVGVNVLLATARTLGGDQLAGALFELAATALAAEQRLPRLRGPDDAGHLGDIWQLAGSTQSSMWQQLNALTHGNGSTQIRRVPSSHRCWELLDDLMRANEGLRPEPNGPLTWTTGIQRVDVTAPCGPSPTLTIRGGGFGRNAPVGVSVVGPIWDRQTHTVAHRALPIVSWSDNQVVVQLDSNSVSGTVAFANVDYVVRYNAWNRDASRNVAAEMRSAGCPGFSRPQPPLLWPPVSIVPDPAPIATFQAGPPRIVAEVTRDPLGSAPSPWAGANAHLQAGETFWVEWTTANADTAALRASGAPASQVLVAAGQPAAGVTGTSGKVRMTAPSRATVVEFNVEASNGTCGVARSPLRIVVTGHAVGSATITVLQSIPGGDVNLITSSGVESLSPATGRSIPLVAEKRTVARVDWWPAIPQIPEEERAEVFAVATLHVTNHGAWPSFSGPLYPGASTADDPPTVGIELPPGPPFSSMAQYQQWVTAGNEPATFNVVIPAEWSKWEATLEATVRVLTPGPMWTVTTAKTVKFHRRRPVRIRYRRHTVPNFVAPTTQQAEAAIRAAAAMLPIPDPDIVVLGNDPAQPSTGYIEDMMAERGGTPTPEWRDEIWLVVGPTGVGGVADADTWPWTAATDATAGVTAHEIGHMFNQRHLALCGAAQNPEQPTSFPDQGNAVVIGWDVWNNRPVRGGIDVMTYCWANSWITPERWRRIFLQLGPP